MARGRLREREWVCAKVARAPPSGASCRSAQAHCTGFAEAHGHTAEKGREEKGAVTINAACCAGGSGGPSGGSLGGNLRRGARRRWKDPRKVPLAAVTAAGGGTWGSGHNENVSGRMPLLPIFR